MNEMTLFNAIVAAILVAKAFNVLAFEPLLYKLRSVLYGNHKEQSEVKLRLTEGRRDSRKAKTVWERDADLLLDHLKTVHGEDKTNEFYIDAVKTTSPAETPLKEVGENQYNGVRSVLIKRLSSTAGEAQQ